MTSLLFSLLSRHLIQRKVHFLFLVVSNSLWPQVDVEFKTTCDSEIQLIIQLNKINLYVITIKASGLNLNGKSVN